MLEARKRLFSRYARNLELVVKVNDLALPLPHSLYYCPLCKRGFTEKDIYSNEGRSNLTIEHVPPGAVGHQKLILTCRNCNNDHGNYIDRQLSKFVNLKSLLSKTPGKKITVKFLLGESLRSNGEIFIKDDGSINFFLDKKRTNPKFHNEISRILEGRSESLSSQVKIIFPKLDERLAKYSIIRAAFLLLFEKFGYSFLFNKSSDKIRRYIQEFMIDEPLPIINDKNVSDDLIGINIITDPVYIKSYLVGIRIEDGNYSNNFAVIIPGAHDLNSEVYSTIEKFIESQNDMNFSVIPPAEVDYITDERFCNLPYTNWFS